MANSTNNANNALAIYAGVHDMMSVGQTLAQSGFFTDTKSQAQAVAKIIAGAELGFGPMASMTGVYIVKGRVTLSANLMAAAVKRSGRYNYRVRKHTEAECEIEFFEDGESMGMAAFTMTDAKRAGLGGDNWNKYPRNMLFARALSNGVRWYCPDIFGGPVYTPDEFDIPVNEDGDVIEGAYTVEQPARPATSQQSDALVDDAQDLGGVVAPHERKALVKAVADQFNITPAKAREGLAVRVNDGTITADMDDAAILEALHAKAAQNGGAS
jgi:hypothetical protein